ncbi:hypothetical protein CL634_10965 [bacterium]|nr:hypothetical protein [bacterium]|tara:strand:- start:381 stop:767 length:387 start_codon:yes stop_codon:yes gene_type:complete
MEAQYAALWFFAGTLAHLAISKIIGLCHGILQFQEMEKFASVYAVALIKDVRVMLKYRFDALAELETMDEEELEKIKEADDIQMFLFGELAVAKMRSKCPKHYLPYLKYSSWRELEQYAEEQKKGGDE